MGEIYSRKYGVEATVDFDLFEVDGVDLRVDAVHASGDTKVMKDEGAEANTSNGFTDEGQTYSIVLTATEMQAARIKVIVVDQTATKVWLDRTLTVETYGHASAQHAVDFDDSVRAGLTALPNAAADAAGGLAISDAGGLDLDTRLGRLTANAATEAKQDIVDTNVDAILADTGTDGVVLAIDAVDADALAANAVDEILDEVIEGTLTMRQALRLLISFIGGKVSGGGTASIVFRNVADDGNRITLTVDADGDRSAVTLDGS